MEAAANDLAVVRPCADRQRRQRRREDLTAHGEHSARLPHSLLEVAGNVGHRDDEEVAEAMALETIAVSEAILEELRHQRFGVREGGDVLANVAWWQYSELALKSPGAAAVIGYRDDRCDVAGVLLEATQQRREAGAAADGDDLRPAPQIAVIVDDVDDALVALRLEERR